MSVIINGVYRYQTVAVEGKSRMYITALDRQREVLKKLISKKSAIQKRKLYNAFYQAT